MKRGAVTKTEAKMLTIWVPDGLVPLLDRGVRKIDSDRSKFIRIAIREKLSRHGIQLLEEAAL
jgi:metal-responsive CopG/Arc/MetJ family transcriptional regulator